MKLHLFHFWIKFGQISGVIEEVITDHFLIFLFVSLENSECESMVSYRNFSQHNYNSFNVNFHSINFENVFILNNVNDSFNYFYDNLFSAYDISFPIKKRKRNKSSKSAWITTELKFCLRKKHTLLKS